MINYHLRHVPAVQHLDATDEFPVDLETAANQPIDCNGGAEHDAMKTAADRTDHHLSTPADRDSVVVAGSVQHDGTVAENRVAESPTVTFDGAWTGWVHAIRRVHRLHDLIRRHHVGRRVRYAMCTPDYRWTNRCRYDWSGAPEIQNEVKSIKIILRYATYGM